MRLKLNDDYKEAIKKVSDGNPGALRVLMECYQKNFYIGQFVVAELDIKGIYGSDIWFLYKDKNKEDLNKFIDAVDPKISEKVELMNNVFGKVAEKK